MNHKTTLQLRLMFRAAVITTPAEVARPLLCRRVIKQRRREERSAGRRLAPDCTRTAEGDGPAGRFIPETRVLARHLCRRDHRRRRRATGVGWGGIIRLCWPLGSSRSEKRLALPIQSARWLRTLVPTSQQLTSTLVCLQGT